MAASSLSPEIQKRIDALPEDIRKLIYSADMDAVVQKIGAARGLHVDQMEALEAEAAAAMIGITEMSDLPQNIADALNIDAQKSAAVAGDLTTMLFSKIRDSMKKSYEAQSMPATSAPSNPPAVAQKSVVMPSRAAAQQVPPAPGMPPMPPARPAPMPPAPPAPGMPPANPPSVPVVPPMGKAAPMQIGPTTQLTGMPKAPVPMAPAMQAADTMLTQKTVQTATAPATAAAASPAVPPKPESYKADPYREPIEP